MEEILKVELIRTFSLLHDIVIPIGIAIITGVVVGFAVGLVLRRRRLKDAMEAEIRKDRLQVIEKLILYLNEYITRDNLRLPVRKLQGYAKNDFKKKVKEEEIDKHLRKMKETLTHEQKVRDFMMTNPIEIGRTISDNLRAIAGSIIELHRKMVPVFTFVTGEERKEIEENKKIIDEIARESEQLKIDIIALSVKLIAHKARLKQYPLLY